jgi:dTDP-4-amino-4,6-dideoxygalactose transaminase
VDKYTWVDLGSSFLMSELQAAFLYPQLQMSHKIKENRLVTWNLYYQLLSEFLSQEKLPVIPSQIQFNGHVFYIILGHFNRRQKLIEYLKRRGIMAIFHYVPLHQAPYWNGRYDQISLPVTEQVSDTLLRLPLFYGIKKKDVQYIVNVLADFLIRNR